jgi:ribonuclease D
MVLLPSPPNVDARKVELFMSEQELNKNVDEDLEAPIATPLLTPLAGTPPVIDTEEGFEKALRELASGSGAFAIDAERASGYKYSARAYLIQIKREGGGLHLLDPIPFGPGHKLFTELNLLLQREEVILHASTQDLPCLRELGISPSKLFDTELGGRIAGLPRVGLGPLLESLLNISLAKEHSAVDWSHRPLPQDWLTYAALDVELLVELREKVYQLLFNAGKWGWAEEEFQSILNAPPAPPRIDPWRRTSGMHKIKKRNQLAVVRALWNVRNEMAAEIDISPSRLLSDAAISQIALSAGTTPITNRKHLEKILRPIGLRARWLENSATWISAITDALSLPDEQLPQARSQSDTLPPIKLWRERFPEKFAPLSHARARLEVVASELSIPLENLISPETVRRICWSAPKGDLVKALTDLGARRWQIEIVAPVLESALLETEPLETQPVEVEGPEAGGEEVSE